VMSQFLDLFFYHCSIAQIGCETTEEATGAKTMCLPRGRQQITDQTLAHSESGVKPPK
jgi:hypothetical protein